MFKANVAFALITLMLALTTSAADTKPKPKQAKTPPSLSAKGTLVHMNFRESAFTLEVSDPKKRKLTFTINKGTRFLAEKKQALFETFHCGDTVSVQYRRESDKSIAQMVTRLARHKEPAKGRSKARPVIGISRPGP